MNKKNLFLVAGVLASIVFINHLFDSEPKTMFGFSVNVWIIRFAWLAITVSSFGNYFKIKKLEKESN